MFFFFVGKKSANFLNNHVGFLYGLSFLFIILFIIHPSYFFVRASQKTDLETARETLSYKSYIEARNTLEDLYNQKKGTSEDRNIILRLIDINRKLAGISDFFSFSRPLQKEGDISFVPASLLEERVGKNELKFVRAMNRWIDLFIGRYPNDPEVSHYLLLKARNEQRLNQHGEAEKILTSIINKFSGSDNAIFASLYLAEYFFYKKSYSKAIPLYENALKSKRSEFARFGKYKIAWSEHNLKNSTRAVSYLKELIDRPKNHSEHRGNLILRDEAIGDMALFLADVSEIENIHKAIAQIDVDQEQRWKIYIRVVKSQDRYGFKQNARDLTKFILESKDVPQTVREDAWVYEVDEHIEKKNYDLLAYSLIQMFLKEKGFSSPFLLSQLKKYTQVLEKISNSPDLESHWDKISEVILKNSHTKNDVPTLLTWADFLFNKKLIDKSLTFYDRVEMSGRAPLEARLSLVEILAKKTDKNSKFRTILLIQKVLSENPLCEVCLKLRNLKLSYELELNLQKDAIKGIEEFEKLIAQKKINLSGADFDNYQKIKIAAYRESNKPEEAIRIARSIASSSHSSEALRAHSLLNVREIEFDQFIAEVAKERNIIERRKKLFNFIEEKTNQNFVWDDHKLNRVLDLALGQDQSHLYISLISKNERYFHNSLKPTEKKNVLKLMLQFGYWEEFLKFKNMLGSVSGDSSNDRAKADIEKIHYNFMNSMPLLDLPYYEVSDIEDVCKFKSDDDCLEILYNWLLYRNFSSSNFLQMSERLRIFQKKFQQAKILSNDEFTSSIHILSVPVSDQTLNPLFERSKTLFDTKKPRLIRFIARLTQGNVFLFEASKVSSNIRDNRFDLVADIILEKMEKNLLVLNDLLKLSKKDLEMVLTYEYAQKVFHFYENWATNIKIIQPNSASSHLTQMQTFKSAILNAIEKAKKDVFNPDFLWNRPPFEFELSRRNSETRPITIPLFYLDYDILKYIRLELPSGSYFSYKETYDLVYHSSERAVPNSIKNNSQDAAIIIKSKSDIERILIQEEVQSVLRPQAAKNIWALWYLGQRKYYFFNVYMHLFTDVEFSQTHPFLRIWKAQRLNDLKKLRESLKDWSSIFKSNEEQGIVLLGIFKFTDFTPMNLKNLYQGHKNEIGPDHISFMQHLEKLSDSIGILREMKASENISKDLPIEIRFNYYRWISYSKDELKNLVEELNKRTKDKWPNFRINRDDIPFLN